MKGYAYAIAAVLFILTGAWGWIQSSRLDAVKAEYAQFAAGVAALGTLAKHDAAEHEARDIRIKKETDEKTSRLAGERNAALVKLRDGNPGRNQLPQAPTASNNPNLLCLDRAEYQRRNGIALEHLFTGARRLADKGTASAVNFGLACEWVNRVAVDNNLGK